MLLGICHCVVGWGQLGNAQVTPAIPICTHSSLSSCFRKAAFLNLAFWRCGNVQDLAATQTFGPRLPPRGAWKHDRSLAASAACSPWLHTHPLWCRTRPPVSQRLRALPPESRSQACRLRPPLPPHTASFWTSSCLRQKTEK